MISEKLEIPLHDRSLVQVSRTDTGAIYLEVYGPGTLKDGHGMLLRGSTLLTDADTKTLLRLLLLPQRDTHEKDWLTESQAFLNELQMVAIRDYVALLTVPLTLASTPLTASKTREKTGCAKTLKKGNEITPRL